MNAKVRLSLLVSLSSVLSLCAGTFTNSFDAGQPPATAIYGDVFVDGTGGPDNSGCLKMTTAPGLNQNAGFIMDDLDAGATIKSFTARFQLVLGGGSATPADGFSFNFAGDLPDGTMLEDGAGSGIRVEFDTYLNAAPDEIGIDVWWKGAIIATHPMVMTDLATWPSYAAVLIQLTTNGTLNVSYNGTNIYTNLVLSGFVPMQGRFGFGSRTGGADENCWLDNLGITTSPLLLPYVLSSTPTGAGIRPDPLITVELHDGSSAALNPGSVQMKLNGASVTPTLTPNGLVTTVQYASLALPSSSSNNVVLTFADNSGSPLTQTNQFSFIVGTYPTLPAKYAATVDIAQPGFTERVFQGGTTTVGSIASAETLLAGLLLNPATGQPFPNTAQPNFDATYTFLEPSVLNYSINAPTSAGDFSNDLQYPGLPGTNASLLNFALEAVAYLYLTPGAYTFGVNSDDGFRLSSITNQLGLFDAGRPAADTTFSFAVTQTGYYPFRLVHFQGGGAASLEWFSVTPAGQKILINDVYTPGYIPAYSKATSSLPYFLGCSPLGAGNRPDKPVVVQMQDGEGIKVNTNAIRLAVNGATVTPSITQAGAVTTVQYLPAAWASGSSNYVVVSFADTEGVPFNQTNQFSFTVLAYTNIPSSYALSVASVDTTKRGFLQRVFQTDRSVPSTVANAELMLAGQLGDVFGNLYPNKARTNTDGTYSFAQTNVLNYNIAVPASAGNFTNDTAFPGIPGPGGGTNTFAFEAITYLYLPVGYYSLGVNSDDGFRLTTAPNPHEVFPYPLAVFDGTRGAADTTTGFGITQAGYYPFRLVYFQATGPASLELFSVALSGQRILVNDTNTAGYIQAYRSANDPQPYVQSAYPYRTDNYFVSADNPIGFSLVDGTPAIQLNSIQLTVNGTLVSPTVTRVNGTNIMVGFVPSSFQQTSNSIVTVQLTYADASGRYSTDSFSFTLHGFESLNPLWTLPPGSRPYLTSNSGAGAQECGLAYNPATGHLLLSSLLNSTTVRGIYILNPLTGKELGQLKLTNASGQFVLSSVDYPAYTIGIADDGAIYAASVKQLAYPFFTYNIYRWGSETGLPTVVFSDNADSFPLRLGDDFRVRGAGTNTQIIAGAGSSYAQAVLFTTANGSSFTATVLPEMSGFYGNFWAGIAFGSNNTFYTEGPGTFLRHVGFDLVANTANPLASYNLAAPAGVLGPLGVDLVNGRLIALGTSSTAGSAHSVNLFNLKSLSTTSTNYPADTSYVPTTYANLNKAGSVAFTEDGSLAFVLDTENGIMAYELNVPSAVRPVLSITRAANQVMLTWTDATYNLQASPAAKGTYTNVPGATSGYNPVIGPGPLFFRLAK